MLVVAGISHLPSAEVAGVSGISPNSSFDEAREAFEAWLPWLSPETDRFNDGGDGLDEVIRGNNHRSATEGRFVNLDRDNQRGEQDTSGASGIASGSHLFTVAAQEWSMATRETQV
jgi:hypothetical protein